MTDGLKGFMRRNGSLICALAAVGMVCVAAAWHDRGFLIEGIGPRSFPGLQQRLPGSTVFAVIGDYGNGDEREAEVARLVAGWNPDFIVTVGDNNYPEGSAATIDPNIGRLYHRYIFDYKGRYGAGADRQRFFPVPGHVDWDTDHLQPYLDFFTLPGNERYYTFTWGPVQFFMLDTDSREPDGVTKDSRQALWLKTELARSRAPWKLVVGHHAPFTSHTVEDVAYMRWPFAQWGADAVLSGYFHVYERLELDGIPYFINGAGGTWVSGFGEVDPHSRLRYNGTFGAMPVVADAHQITFGFINKWGKVIDRFQLRK